MSEQHEYCMVLSTSGTEKNRDEIIKGLLEGQLAACIQTMV
ncbi:divalent-cation tolerance protein CutA, partial [Vibrio harveyi]